MFVELLDTLQMFMNFTYVINRPSDGVFGNLQPNGTWTGVIGQLQVKNADIGLSDLSVTEQRSKVVDFTNGIFISSNKLYMKTPRRSLSWTTFSEVFDDLFMGSLMLEFITLSVIFFAIFYFVNNETTIGAGTSISTVFLCHLALTIPVSPSRIPGRILVLTVCLSGALVFWSWNAGLISLLTAEIFTFPITSLKVR